MAEKDAKTSQVPNMPGDVTPGDDRETLENAHPADAADHLENLPLEEQLQAVGSMSTEAAAESIAEMGSSDRIQLMQSLTPESAAGILADMAVDDAVDLLDELDEAHKEQLIDKLEDAHAEELLDLLRYDPDTAGGVMNTEAVVLDERLTVDQAIGMIRKQAEDTEIPYYAYLVDENERLVGVLSMRDLLTARPGTMLENLIRNQTLVSVTFDVDREEVAHLISHYNFLALPVVDYQDRLLGVVTVDDIIDIIHEEASEDMKRMVGAAADETSDSPWTYSVRKRLPWLVVNVLNSAGSAFVVSLFEGTIQQMAFLAVLMPVVANQAGNTGQQALAVMIRQLALEKFDRRRAWVAVWRETKIGLVNGGIISLLVLCAVALVTHNAQLSAVMALALFLDMIIGALSGAAIPLLLKELGRDPAQSSSIFLTALTDSFGFLTLLGLAALLLLP